MNVTIDAAKLPAGLLVAAALLHFLPAYATPAGFVALAVGAFLATAAKAKGLVAGLVLVAGAVLFTNLTGIGSPGLDRLGDQVTDPGALVQGLTERAG